MKALLAATLLAVTLACGAGPGPGSNSPQDATVEIFVQNDSGGPVALFLQGYRVATVQPGKHCVDLKLPSRGTSHYQLGVKHLAEKTVYSDARFNFGEIRFWAMNLRHINMLSFDFNSLQPSPACAVRSGASRDFALGLRNAS